MHMYPIAQSVLELSSDTRKSMNRRQVATDWSLNLLKPQPQSFYVYSTGTFVPVVDLNIILWRLSLVCLHTVSSCWRLSEQPAAAYKLMSDWSELFSVLSCLLKHSHSWCARRWSWHMSFTSVLWRLEANACRLENRSCHMLWSGWPLVWKTWKCQGIWNMSGKKSCHGKVSQNCSLLDEFLCISFKNSA